MSKKLDKNKDSGKNTLLKESSFNYKLDDKDKKILNELFENPRSSIAEISNKTKIKRDSVKYRFNKMLKANLVKFKTELNLKEMGFMISCVIIASLQNLTLDTEKEIDDFLKKNKSCEKHYFLSGKNDCLIVLRCKNLDEQNYFVHEFRTKFSNHIKDFEIDGIIKEWEKSVIDNSH